ncbi:MTA/SAH nucleosidase [Neorhizobium galegae bv. orientalis]|nr:MTA/SAH nucleosidase [Neorhizobium galegae bv. orientalis]
MSHNPHSRMKPGDEFKFAIITALDEEFSAVRRALPGGMVKTISDIPFKSAVCSFTSDDTVIHGEMFQPHDTGRVEAAVLAGYIFARRRYKYVLLVGVAGGFATGKSQFSNNPISLGDVVFASEIIDAEFQKITQYGPEYRDRRANIPNGVVNQYIDYIKLVNSQKLSHTNGFHDGRRYNLHVGSVISGSKIVASKQAQKEIAGRAQGILPAAVEMEGIAVAIANFRLNPGSGFAMIRGISDFADENKNVDEVNWRKVACQHAAETAVDFLMYVAKDNNWEY